MLEALHSPARGVWLAGTLLLLGISKMGKLDLLGKQAVSPEQCPVQPFPACETLGLGMKALQEVLPVVPQDGLHLNSSLLLPGLSQEPFVPR